MSCIVCGSKGLTALNVLATHSMLRCSTCGCIFSDSAVNDLAFLEDRQPHRLEFLERRVVAIFRRILAKAYLNYLEQHIDLKNVQAVLEIGSGEGFFLSLLENRGIRTVGIEASKSRVAFSVSKAVRWGYFDESYPIEGPFNLICLIQSMYYFRDYYRILEKLKSLLLPGSHIFIATLNADSERVIDHIGKRSTEIVCLMTKKNWTHLADKLDFQMDDYSLWEPNVYIDTVFVNRLLGIKYLAMPSRSYERRGEGYCVHVILRSRNNGD